MSGIFRGAGSGGGGSGDVTAAANLSDNTIIRGDGGLKGVQDSGITIDDSDVVSGITQLNVDNIRIDGNTISSTDANGNINLTPNGSGVVAGTQLTLTTALDETYGGTAQTTYTTGDILYASASNTLSKLAVGDGVPLFSDGTTPEYFDIKNYVYIYDDFLSTGATGNTGVVINVSGGGSTRTNEAGHPGVFQIRTSTSATGGATVGHADGIAPGAGRIIYDSIARLSDLSDGTETYVARLGLMPVGNISSDPTNGILFRYTHTASAGNWEIWTNNGAGPTTADSGIAADTNYHRFTIIVNAGGTSVNFYIDDVEVTNSPLSTTIPTAAISDTANIKKSAGTTERSVYTDVLSIYQKLTSDRY